MTIFIPPTSAAGYTRSEWREDLDRIEARLEPFLIPNPAGEVYIDPATTPGPLAKAYDALVQIGLEHGWMEV